MIFWLCHAWIRIPRDVCFLFKNHIDRISVPYSTSIDKNKRRMRHISRSNLAYHFQCEISVIITRDITVGSTSNPCFYRRSHCLHTASEQSPRGIKNIRVSSDLNMALNQHMSATSQGITIGNCLL